MRPVNQSGQLLIKASEQLALKAYLCPAGVPTIGWGHTKGVRMGQQISREQAEMFFQEDLAVVGEAIARLVKVPLTDNQYAALASFVFNLGEGTLARSTLLKLLNAGQFQAVPAQLNRFVWGTVGGVRKQLNGLIKRRAAEAALWDSHV